MAITPAKKALETSLLNADKLSYDAVILKLENQISLSSNQGFKDCAVLFDKDKLSEELALRVLDDYKGNGYEVSYDPSFSSTASQIILIWG